MSGCEKHRAVSVLTRIKVNVDTVRIIIAIRTDMLTILARLRFVNVDIDAKRL